MVTEDYEDGVSSPAWVDRSSPRIISNEVFDQDYSKPSPYKHSSFLRQWWQFLDHDIDLSPHASPSEYFPIKVPQGDLQFDPFNEWGKIIPLERSQYTIEDGVRQQVNVITSYIDGSMVYGSSHEKAIELRTMDGTWMLRTQVGNNGEVLMHMWEDGNFIWWDARANEQVALIAMHTLFVREHNYWAEKIAKKFATLSWDDIYALARDIVTAEIQAITYNEYLPIVFWKNGMGTYEGYDKNVDATIANIFSTAAFRFGHTQLPTTIQRVWKNKKEIPAGHLSLRNAFFRPDHVFNEGADAILRWLFYQTAETIDAYMIDDVRNMLFWAPGAWWLDLASLNIQRWRDHGLPSLNDTREQLGLDRHVSFEEISNDENTVLWLQAAYDSVDDIDVWVGGLAETPVKWWMLWQTFTKILKKQFTALRSWDRFRYENRYSPEFVEFIETQTLNTILARNTTISKGEMPKSVFYVK